MNFRWPHAKDDDDDEHDDEHDDDDDDEHDDASDLHDGDGDGFGGDDADVYESGDKVGGDGEGGRPKPGQEIDGSEGQVRAPQTVDDRRTTAQKVSGKTGDDEPPRHQEYLRKQNGDEANVS